MSKVANLLEFRSEKHKSMNKSNTGGDHDKSYKLNGGEDKRQSNKYSIEGYRDRSYKLDGRRTYKSDDEKYNRGTKDQLQTRVEVKGAWPDVVLLM